MRSALLASQFLGLMCALGLARAQPTYIEKTFGGEKADMARAVVAFSDGGFAVAGQTESKGAGEMDAWLLRFDRDGRPLWDKTFGGSAWDEASDIAALPDGGLALVGFTKSQGSGGSDAWVLRLDSAGGLLWEKTFGGTREDEARAVVALPDGGLVVTGLTESKGAGQSDVWVLRLDGAGQLVWDKTFGGPKIDPAHDIAALPDGGYAVAAHTFSQGAGGKDAWLLRLDDQGHLLWDKTFGGPGDDGLSCIAALPEGTLLVGGENGSKAAGQTHPWLLKLDARGDPVWEKTYGGPYDGAAAAIIALSDGIALAATTVSQPTDNFDAWLLRLTARGDVLAERKRGRELADTAGGMAVLADGSLVAVGLTQVRAENWDGWVMIFPPGIAPVDVPLECTKYLPDLGRTIHVPCPDR